MPTHCLLLVLQSPDNVRLLELLREAGYVIESAGDGRQAVALASVNRYDLIVMSLDIPVMDGLNAVREIRANESRRSLPNVPVLGLAADPSKEVRETCLRNGMNDCVAIGLSRPEMLTRVARVISTAAAAGMEMYLADLIPGYLAARRKEVATMQAALAASQFAEIVAIAHRLRGTGGTYGRPQLTVIGAALEAAAERGDADAVARDLQWLAQELGQ